LDGTLGRRSNASATRRLRADSREAEPNLTCPFGSYICVVDIDKGTGEVNIRRFVAVDDCGNIINPMIVERADSRRIDQIELGPALYEEIQYDESGNKFQGSFMNYLLPRAMETPNWETDKTCIPSPHHPLGRWASESPRLSEHQRP
jgi:aerobic carbon-monoxide dehydrogenase large subunit